MYSHVCNNLNTEYQRASETKILTRSSTHLSKSLLLLNSHRRPVFVIAYVESAISPRPQATSTKSLFLCSPNMADRPIKGTGSLYCTKFPLSLLSYLYSFCPNFANRVVRRN